MGRTGTTRRRALLATGAAAASGLLAGCTSDGPGGRRSRSAAERAARAEAALRRRATASATALMERYDAVTRAHPSLAARLAPLRASAAAHRQALGADGPAASPTPSTRPAGATAPVPADPAAALEELAATARRTADGHSAALLSAPPEYARLLASVAASCAAQAYLLTDTGARS
ncbi:hypothetical protein [Streptomyces purpureus]|uniref:Lipoprotein n=1 Tax=Streptomyces purpureus TaxID=1951 RepID=A0A918LU87_9ACTN|nr:hypothetical protein [Streptomyces purpureus]GGT50146.1 hypothetical protein GCM10014713_50420 [Streptomyces purpureus]